MLLYYLKIAFRNILRNRWTSFISIISLSLGITCSILILFWSINELSYDGFHKNKNQIFRLVNEWEYDINSTHYVSVPAPLGPHLNETFPEIIDYVRLRSYNETVGYNEIKHFEDNFYYSDPSLFTVFTFTFLSGDPKTCLEDINSIAISEETAKKYFNNENPINKLLTLNNEDVFKITGVYKIPENSNFNMDFVVPISFLESKDFALDNWDSYSWPTYILLKKNSDHNHTVNNIRNVLRERNAEDNCNILLQPLDKIHLYELNGEKGGIITVYIFLSIALFTIVLAIINFINLTTSRSITRIKEVGIRKISGGSRISIFYQFVIESLLLSLISMILAYVLAELLSPTFNQLAGNQVGIDYSIPTILISILVTFTIGFITGIYPSIVFSSISIKRIITGKISNRNMNPGLRRMLVIFQFVISISIIICTLIVSNQLSFIQNKNIGFNKENILYFRLNDEIQSDHQLLKNSLLEIPAITNSTCTFQLPTHNRLSSECSWEGQDEGNIINFNISVGDYDYIKTFEMEIVEGRGFDSQSIRDSSGVLLNEEAIRQMNIENPIGKNISGFYDGPILGIVKDYNFMPVTKKIEPIIIGIDPRYYRYLVVRIKSNNIKNTIHNIESVFNEIAPNYPFEYNFLDESYNNLYKSESRIGSLSKVFTLISIIIACLGLLGLTIFMTEQKTKEIAIRKIAGSGVGQIILLLNTQYIKWISIALILSIPISHIIMSNWLSNFAYRINIQWWIYLYAGILVLSLSIITVIYISIKAALKNPVEALRFE